MEEFLRYIISQLVEYPDEVVISGAETPGGVVYHVAMRKSDLGKIIGKGGHTIQALRTLLHASASKRGIKAGLEIVE